MRGNRFGKPSNQTKPDQKDRMRILARGVLRLVRNAAEERRMEMDEDEDED